MNRQDRRKNSGLGRGTKRRAWLDVERMEGRALLAIFTVTNTSPSAAMAGSLGYEITQSNATPATAAAPNLIQFHIAPSNVQTIALTTPLPGVTVPTDFQGYTEPGSSPNSNPLTAADNASLAVVVTGSRSVANGLILNASAGGSRVEGLDLEGFTAMAITVDAANVSIAGNDIGTGPNGQPSATTINANGLIVNGATGATIGGPTAPSRNVITGNTTTAVTLMPNGPTSASGDLIEGNFIGTNADGTLPANPAFGNGSGVIVNQGSNNTIGGSLAGAGNLIAGNGFAGVVAQTSTGLVLAGDLIQANGGDGVDLTASPGASITSSTIGGTAAAQDNGGVGISVVGSSGVTIGGTLVGAGDLIAGDFGGITFDATSTGGLIAGSTISGNTGVGISLAGQSGSVLSGIVLSGDTVQNNEDIEVFILFAPGIIIRSSTIGGPGPMGLGIYGVQVEESANVSIQGTTIVGNTLDGVDLIDSPGAVLSGDVVDSNTDLGVEIATSSGVMITSTTIGGTGAGQGNGLDGIDLVGSTGATIGGTLVGAGDLIAGNAGIGIDFDNTSTGGLVAGSTITGNVGIGISFDGTADSNLSGEALVGDTVSANAGGGVVITNAPATTVQSSTIGGKADGQGNGAVGILIQSSAGVSIGGTTTGDLIAGNVGDGVEFASASPNGLVSGSTVTANLSNNTDLFGDGVDFFTSPGGVVSTSILSDNQSNGVGLFNTGTIDSDLIEGNGFDGIFLSQGPGSTIISSTIGGTGADQSNQNIGIVVVSSDNVTIGGLTTGDTIELNVNGGVDFFGSNGGQVVGSGVFSNFADGVYFDATSSGGLVSDSTISGNTGVGVNFLGMTGSSLSGEVLSEDTIESNSGGGVLITDAPGTTLTTSFIGAAGNLGNGFIGIDVESSANVILQDLMVLDNASAGIYVNDSPNVTITGSTSQSNLGDGLNLNASPAGLIDSDTFGGPGTPDNTGAGISVSGSTDVTIGGTGLNAGVLVSGNLGDGIDLDATSTGAQILGSRITGNLGIGISLAGDSASNLTGVSLNLDLITANARGGVFIRYANGASLTDTTIGDDPASGEVGNGLYGIFVTATANVAIGPGMMIRNNQGSGIIISNTDGVSDNATVQGSTIVGNLGVGIEDLGSTGLLLTGDTVQSNLGNGILISQVANATVTLNTISGNAGDGILVGGSSGLDVNTDLILGNLGDGIGVTLNSNGASITSNTIGGTEAGSANGGFGIDVSGSTGATIGGTLAGAGNLIEANTAGGITFVMNADSGLVLDDTISGNLGVGVSVNNSIDAVITSDMILSNGGGGVLLISATSATVDSSQAGGQTLVQENRGFGIAVLSSSGVTIGGTLAGAGLSVSGNFGTGIVIGPAVTNSPGSDNTSVLSDTVAENSGDGIDVSHSLGVVFNLDAIAVNAGVGISLTAAASATITGGGFDFNGSIGLEVVDSSIDLVNSELHKNNGVGLLILDPNSAPTVTGSTIYSNMGGGVLISGSTLGGSISSTTIGGTTASEGNGGFGVSITGSSGVTIGTMGSLSVTVSNNSGPGISATNSPMLTLQGLIVESNGGAGIALSSSINSIITDNIVLSNLGDGVDLFGSGAAVTGLITAKNAGDGLLSTGGSIAIVNTLSALGNGSSGVADSVAVIRLTMATITGNSGVGISIINPTPSFAANTSVELVGVVAESNLGGGLSLVNDSLGGTFNAVTIGGTTSALGNRLFGISLVNSPNVILGNNATILVQDNGGVGILLDSSSGVVVMSGVVIANNAGDGIAANGSINLNVQFVTILNNSGSGISLAGGSNGALIAGGEISNNLGDGVVARGSSNLQIGLPTTTVGFPLQITGNEGAGINVTGASAVTSSSPMTVGIDEQVIQSNRGGGIILDQVSGHVANSTIGGSNPYLGNGLVGISIARSPGFRLNGLMVQSNAGDGIVVVSGSDGVSIVGGAVSGNAGTGIFVSDSSLVHIAGTTTPLGVTKNLADGIEINFSPGVVIVGTISDANHLSGISLVSSPSATIGSTAAGMAVENNGSDGIDLNTSQGSAILNTLVDQNRAMGIHVISSANVAIGPAFNANTVTNSFPDGLEVSSLSNGSDGIDLDDSPGSTLIDVAANNNKSTGVRVLNSPQAIIGFVNGSTTIQHNGGDGLDLINSGGAIVSHDQIMANTGSGVWISGTVGLGDIVASNGITESGGFGLVLANSANNVIGADGMSNFIEGNDLTGVAIVGSMATNNVVQYDTIAVNLGSGVLIAGGAKGNIIGGLMADAGDGIEGNIGDGVSIADSSGNYVLRKDAIATNGGSGVRISGADSVGNEVLDATIKSNGADGITIIQAVGTTIGAPGHPNEISSNFHDGISIEGSTGSTSTPTLITGNFVGTDSAILFGMGNVNQGITIDNSKGVQVGSATPGGGNVVSANRQGGIVLVNSSDNTLVGNRIGTDLLGRVLLADSTTNDYQPFGVLVDASSGNTIGGTAAGSANIIAGPNAANDFGVELFSAGASGNLVIGNLIGITGPVGPAASPYFALGDHVGIFVNGARNNAILANTLGGSDLAEIAIAGTDATGNQVGAGGPLGNLIDGAITTFSAGASASGSPVGVLILQTQSTAVLNNHIVGLSEGVEVSGTPIDLPAIATGNGPPVNSIIANGFSGDGIGVLIQGAPANQVVGNGFADNSVAGVEIFGAQASYNTIGGSTAGQANLFTDNLNGVLIENAGHNAIVDNGVANSGPVFVNPVTGSFQAGVYVDGPLAVLNAVLGNTIQGVEGFGIVFSNTPQTASLANFAPAGQATGSLILNLDTSAALAGSPATLAIPTELVPIPTQSTTVQAASISVRISSAFSGRSAILSRGGYRINA